jgi:hypothetical protein
LTAATRGSAVSLCDEVELRADMDSMPARLATSLQIAAAMFSQRLASCLLPLALTVTMAACIDDDSTPYLAPITCSAASCLPDLDEPASVAVGGALWLEVIDRTNMGFSVRATDPSRLAIDVSGTELELRAIRPGEVDVELLDTRGDVVDSFELTVVAPDRLEAALRWVDGGEQILVGNLKSEQAQTVPHKAAVGVIVSPYAGARRLQGLIDYQIEGRMPAGGRLDINDFQESILYTSTGEHTITYATGELSARFIITTL